MVAMIVLQVPSNRATFGSVTSSLSNIDGSGQPIGPVADLLGDLINVLRRVRDALKDAKEAVDENAGPLDEAEKSRVADDLDAALADIDQILDPHQYPSLNPPDAGLIDASFDPVTLTEYARTSYKLAQDAVDEANSKLVEHKVIGSRLKTIEYLITRESPHNYRTKAGIASQD